MNNRTLGAAGEAYAKAFLETLGYDIIAQGVRYGRNEIDIVAREGGYVVYIEVKTRTSHAMGYPAEAVTAAKRRAISAAAMGAAVKNGWLYERQRFDVVEVMRTPAGFDARVIQNAFDFEPPV